MGSPLAPVVANIFMGFYKSNWLIEYNLNFTYSQGARWGKP